MSVRTKLNESLSKHRPLSTRNNDWGHNKQMMVVSILLIHVGGCRQRGVQILNENTFDGYECLFAKNSKTIGI